MKKILKLKYISSFFVFLFVFCFAQTVLAWIEPVAGPIYDPVITTEKAYYPSVLKISESDYRMWYQSNSVTSTNATVAYATSADGLSWTLVTNEVSGLLPNNAGHPHVEFADGKFRIWYWNASTPYTNNAMHYAESVDGITWTNDSAITGNLISSTSGLWNSGSYGAVDVLINNSPTNVGTNPFDYKYAMYYVATSGGYEQIALGYSADGIAWTLYGTGPVLSKGLTGAWDSGYATTGTVIRGSVWEMWYSGGISTSSEGIGYATSTDGLTWTKSVTNPFMSKNDGVAWRNSRTYTPSVIDDGDFYKMWFTGKDATNYTVGYAILEKPVPPATINILKVVVNDNGRIKIISDFPLFVNDTSVVSGITNTFPAGAYTVTEDTDLNYTSTFSGDCPNGNITLVPGDNKFCVITNDDIAPVIPAIVFSGNTNNNITIIKQVINDSGGTATYTDFPLFLNGNPVASGASTSFASGIYTVTETNLAGYVRTFSGNCDANGVINHGGIGTQNDICIVTNNDIGTPIPIIPPLIDLVKIPSPLALPSGPGPVTYTYTLRNVGMVPVADITMIGDTCSPITLTSGDINNDAKLDLTETWIYHCTTTLSKTHTNTVTAIGWANGISAVEVASATVVVGLPGLPDTGIVPPLIHVTKIPNPLLLSVGGGAIIYTNKVTNLGIVPVANVSLVDDKCGPVEFISGDTNGDSKLDVTETWTYTCSSNLTKTTTNTVTVKGNANGFTARDFAIATVVVAPSIPVSFPNTGGLYNFGTATLGNGSRGNTVMELQRFLNVELNLGLVVDGKLGPKTIIVIKKWQKDHGLVADGLIGPKTKMKMNIEAGNI